MDYIKAKLGKSSPSLMDAVIGNSCSRFVTVEKADEVKQFFEEHKLPSNVRRISQLVEGMKTNGLFLLKIHNSALIHASFWA